MYTKQIFIYNKLEYYTYSQKHEKRRPTTTAAAAITTLYCTYNFYSKHICTKQQRLVQRTMPEGKFMYCIYKNVFYKTYTKNYIKLLIFSFFFHLFEVQNVQSVFTKKNIKKKLEYIYDVFGFFISLSFVVVYTRLNTYNSYLRYFD